MKKINIFISLLSRKGIVNSLGCIAMFTLLLIAGACSDSKQVTDKPANSGDTSNPTPAKEDITILWEGDFSPMEGHETDNYHWSGPKGLLTILNNTDKSYELDLSMELGSPNPGNLKIDNAKLGIADNLKIQSYPPLPYNKTIVVPPGTHQITFNCDAKLHYNKPDPRTFSFQVRNFKVTRKSAK